MHDEMGLCTGYLWFSFILIFTRVNSKTTMFAGSDGCCHKSMAQRGVEFTEEPVVGGRVELVDYQDGCFPVTLKAGDKCLIGCDLHPYSLGATGWLFSDSNPDAAEYTVISPGTGFAFSTDATSVRVGDTFTLRVNAEKVTGLAGWQFDLTFNPDVLEVVDVNEGGFLKRGGGTTFFQQGTIDNTTGSIVELKFGIDL